MFVFHDTLYISILHRMYQKFSFGSDVKFWWLLKRQPPSISFHMAYLYQNCSAILSRSNIINVNLMFYVREEVDHIFCHFFIKIFGWKIYHLIPRLRGKLDLAIVPQKQCCAKNSTFHTFSLYIWSCETVFRHLA